jgi:hypothetical protein
LVYEKHICKKQCSKPKCKKNCLLKAGHQNNCFCGECKCGKRECQYKDISWNCKEICMKNLVRNGPHLCEEENHLCNEDCKYKNITKSGCLGKCKFPLGHKGNNHFYSNEKENINVLENAHYKVKVQQKVVKFFVIKV